jgi:hypothetical protein
MILFTLSAIGFGLSAVEYFGWGPRLESFLDRVRVRSMQITLRNGEVNPKLTDLYQKVLGFSLMGVVGISLLITVLLLPPVLFLGKDNVSGFIGSGGTAGVLAATVFGPLAVVVGLVAAYLIWCSVVALLADVLNWLHRFPKGVVSTVGFFIGAICFFGELLSK